VETEAQLPVETDRKGIFIGSISRRILRKLPVVEVADGQARP
jgi:hypothetical protein